MNDDSQATESQNADSTLAGGTPQDGNQTPSPTDTGANGGSQNGSDDASQSSEGEPSGEDRTQKALAEYGKLQKVQGEYKELQDRYKQTEDTLRQVRSAIVKSGEEVYRQTMKNLGHDENNINATISQLKQRGVWDQVAANAADGNVQTPQGNVQVQGQQGGQVDPDKLYQDMYGRFKADMAQEQALEQLFTTYPDLKDTPDDKHQEAIDMINKARYVANARAQVEGSRPYADLLVEEYGRLSGKTAEQIEAAREQGRRQGLAMRASSSASSMPPASGQQPGGAGSLSDEDIQAAQLWGMTAEEWAEAKRNSGVVT